MTYTVILKDGHKKKQFKKTFRSSRQRVQWIVTKRRYWKEVILLEEGQELKEKLTAKKRAKGYKVSLEKQIVAKKRSVVKAYCIYALIDKDKVVYIGQSRSIMGRLQCHLNSSKKFDSYAIVEWIAVEDNRIEYVNKREMEYIKDLRPKYNIAGNM